MKYTGERIIPEDSFCGPKTNIYKEHFSRYNFAAQYVKNKKILDIACGVGYGCKILVDGGASFVIGGDISDESINYANNHYKSEKNEFIKQNLEKLDFEDKAFDCVISFETLEHIKEQKKVISELSRIIKPGGILIISTPNKDSRTSVEDNANIFHEKELTIKEFEDILKEHFPKIELFSQRLIKNMGIGKIIIRNIILKAIKLDSKKIYSKIFPNSIYGSVYNTIDDTDGNYIPIPYSLKHKPKIAIAVCYK